MPNYPYDQLSTPLDLDNLGKANGNWAKIAADIASVDSRLTGQINTQNEDFNNRLNLQKSDYTGRLNNQYADYVARFAAQRTEYVNGFKSQNLRIDNIVKEISVEAFNEVIDEAKLNWKSPVVNFSALASTYPTASNGDAAQTLDDNKTYRFNGSSWVFIQQFGSGPFTDVYQKLSNQKYYFDVKSYGAVGDGVTDDTAAVRAAVVAAIDANTITGLGGPLKRPAEVFFPPGTFLCDTITIDLRVPNNFVSEAPYIKMVGTSSTRIKLANTSNILFDIPKASIYMSTLNLYGHETGTGIKLGRTFLTDDKLNVVSQSEFDNVRMFGFNRGYDIHHAFDSKFNNGGIFSSKGSGPVGIHLRPHDTDNCNNLVFTKLHIEEMPGGIMFFSEGADTSPSRLHNNIYFYAPHFETRYINTKIMRIFKSLNVYFSGGQYAQNNSHGLPLGILPETNAVPAFEIESSHVINYLSINLFRVGTANYLKKITESIGTTKHVTFDRSYFVTGSSTVNPGVNDIMQHDNTSQQFTFRGCIINDKTTSAVSSSISTVVSSASSRNRKFYQEFVDDNTRLKTSYSNDNTGYASPVTISDVYIDGRFGISALSTIRPYVVPDGTIASIDIAFTTNSNKTGMYFVFAQGPFPAFAIIFRHGTNVYPVTVGASADVNNTLQNVAGKLNIGIESNLLKVKNNLGSERSVMVMPMVF